VHILIHGRIVAEGGPELADQLEEEGYAAFTPAGEEATDDEPTARPVVRPGSLDELFANP
jgi:Fe-S cluster assembly ATP-binding protein